MSEQDDVSQDEVVPTITPEEALAAQMEGFSGADTTPEPAQTAEAAAQAVTDDAAAKEAQEKAEAETKAAEAAAQAAKPVIAGYTEAQITELLKKAEQYDSVRGELSKVYGKFGSIQQALDKLSANQTTGIALTEEDVAELEKEYSPEFAKAMLGVLNKFGSKLGGKAPKQDDGKPAAEVVDTAKEIEDRLAKATQKLELKMLNREHKDWRTVVRVQDAAGNDAGFNPAFVKWSENLTDADREKLYNSWDFEFLSDKIGAYKEHLKAEADAKAKAEADAKEAASKRQVRHTPHRLETAAQQQGVSGSVTTKSALQEQLEGYNESR